MLTEYMPSLLIFLLALPLLGAIAVAAMGPRRGDWVRAISLGTTLLMVILSALIAYSFVHLERPSHGLTFLPAFSTQWDLLPLGTNPQGPTLPPPAIQFFIGVDGLNVWMLVLIGVLMVSSVLVSWTAVQERVNEFYAWLLVLGLAMVGVFLAFDIMLFYVFFELTLVPLFFLIGIWGGPQRQYAARKFFIYTLAGSVITWLGLLAVVLTCHAHGDKLTFSIPDLISHVQLHLKNPEERPFWINFQTWVFLTLIVGFSIKVPLFPVHTWLPLAHTEAPTAGSVLLAGVLLKIGAYGFLRLCLPLAPDASLSIGVKLIGILAVIGIIYGAFCALVQEDIKKLVAYSSVSHLGFCMLGVFALNEAGLNGSLLQMINHGLSTGLLFLLVGMLYERYHTRMMSDYGGMSARLKVLGTFMVFTCLSSVGLPGLNGFVGEALVFLGMFDLTPEAAISGRTLAVFGSFGIVLGAWYLMSMLRRVFFGPMKEPAHEGHGPIHDLDFRELAAVVPIMALCVALGVYPQPVLNSAREDIRVISHIMEDAQKRSRDAADQDTSSAEIRPTVIVSREKAQ